RDRSRFPENPSALSIEQLSTHALVRSSRVQGLEPRGTLGLEGLRSGSNPRRRPASRAARPLGPCWPAGAEDSIRSEARAAGPVVQAPRPSRGAPGLAPPPAALPSVHPPAHRAPPP